MQTKIIEKIAKNYELIKSLDAEIIQLEKLFNTILNDNTEMSAQFSVNKTPDIAEKPKQTKSEITIYQYFEYMALGTNKQEKTDDNKITVTTSFNNITAAKLIAVILSEKQNERKELITKTNNQICGK